jgi:hypothetical protein
MWPGAQAHLAFNSTTPTVEEKPVHVQLVALSFGGSLMDVGGWVLPQAPAPDSLAHVLAALRQHAASKIGVDTWWMMEYERYATCSLRHGGQGRVLILHPTYISREGVVALRGRVVAAAVPPSPWPHHPLTPRCHATHTADA